MIVQICIVNLFDTYYKYFKHQAETHPEILHTATSKAFELISVEEAFGDFRTIGKKGVVLRLLEFSYSFQENGMPLKYTTGGFLILKNHSSREDGATGFNAAMITTETVTDDIIQKMIADSQNNHPLFKYSLNTADKINVQMAINKGDIGYSGFICTFTIAPYWRACLAEDPETPAWTDGGVTPHIL